MFALPDAGFARRCLREGFSIAYESDYLRTRGWGQFATIGDLDRAALEPLFAALGEVGVEAEANRRVLATV